MVQTARCWNKNFVEEVATLGIERSKADPCVLREVHFDDKLISTKEKEEMEQFLKDMGMLFPIKDLGEASFYMGCHSSRVMERREIRIDQHVFSVTLASR